MDSKLIKLFLKENNLIKLNETISEGDVRKNIEQLKQMDFLIDFRGDDKFQTTIDEIIKTSASKDIKDYATEINIINNIFKESRSLQDKINLIPPKKVLALVLYWGSKILGDCKSTKMQKYYRNNNVDMVLAYDKRGDRVAVAVKSLLHNSQIYDGKEFKYRPRSAYIASTRWKHHKIVIDYIEDSFKVSAWMEKYNLWKESCISIEKIDDENICLKIIDQEKIYKKVYPIIKDRINQAQYEGQAIAEYLFQTKIQKKKLILDIYDYIFQRVMDKHFCCFSENLLVENVKISDWLRAYSFIQRISEYDVDKIYPFSFLNNIILDFARFKSKSQWIKLFVRNGINCESAEIIFNHLIFNKKSTDLYDYPFIPVKNKYTIMRTLTKGLHPARVLISRFNSRDINIDVKGKNFENNLIKFFESINLPYVKLHNKKDGQEYECDVVFYIDKTFVFCECKNRTGHNLDPCYSEKYTEDAEQLKRISDFYSQHMELVFKAFEDKKIRINKKSYDIKNIVIHLRAVDGIIKHNGVYIMDLDSFIIPFDRGFIWEDYIKDKKIKDVFEGEISINKLFKFYNSEFYVYNYRAFIEYFDHSIGLGKFKLRIEDYKTKEIFTEDFFEKEKKNHMKNIFLQNGIPKEKINNLLKFLS